MSKRRRLERFTEAELDELLTAPATRGLEKVLKFTRPVIQEASVIRVTTLGESDSSGPVTSIPHVSTPVETALDISAPAEHSVALEHPEPQDVSTVHVSTPVETLLPAPDQRMFLPKSKKRLFRPQRPSDAHTDGEDRLYQFMWQNGRKHAIGVRLYSGSMTTLAKALGRDDRNTRPLIESLARKLSIAIAKEQDYRTGHPRMYFVYDYSEIGTRRKKAGLEWAVKNKGIQLLTVSEAAVLAASDVSTPVDTGPVETDTGPVETVETTAVQTPVFTPVQSSHLPYWRNVFEKPTQESSTSDLIVATLMQSTGTTDDDAARRIVMKCREKASDASDEEIAYFIRTQADRIRRMRNIENPIGLLITQVPRCFEGESFRQFREAERQRHEAEAKQYEEMRVQWHRILNDASASIEDRQWASKMLEASSLEKTPLG
jgi:hypothetical protein